MGANASRVDCLLDTARSKNLLLQSTAFTNPEGVVMQPLSLSSAFMRRALLTHSTGDRSTYAASFVTIIICPLDRESSTNTSSVPAASSRALVPRVGLIASSNQARRAARIGLLPRPVEHAISLKGTVRPNAPWLSDLIVDEWRGLLIS
jgi:hypothetical protein